MTAGKKHELSEKLLLQQTKKTTTVEVCFVNWDGTITRDDCIELASHLCDLGDGGLKAVAESITCDPVREYIFLGMGSQE